MPHSVEEFIRVYNDDTGDHIQVGPDADGFELVELIQSDNGKNVARITMTIPEAKLVADALNTYLTRLKSRSAT
jgi:hypothetical protein